MTVPNGYCARRDQGATYYWPADRSTGSIWLYPDVSDPVELLDIWADLAVITFRRLGLSAEGELLTLDCIGLLSSNDHKVISGAAQQPWPVPMVQALFRARVSCKEPYKVVDTACLDGPCDRPADLSARDVPVAVSAQATIEAPVLVDLLAQAETNTDDELHNSPIDPGPRKYYVAPDMPQPLDNPPPAYPAGATLMYMDLEKAFDHLRDYRGHDWPAPNRGSPQGSTEDPTRPVSPISKSSPNERSASALDSPFTAWSSWDCVRRDDSMDYETHPDNKLFRVKASCVSCGQTSWSNFGYGSTPYLELVSNGWNKGKHNWKRSWCPECCRRYYDAPQNPDYVPHSGIRAW